VRGLDKLIKDKKDAERQFNETSERMEGKRDMNDRHWKDRASCVESLKQINKDLADAVKS